MWKAIVFDFDYTLGDSSEGIILCANTALERMSLPAAEAEAIRRTIGRTLRETYGLLTGRSDPAEAERFRTLFREKADEVMAWHTELYPDAKDVLRALRERGLRTAIVTTKGRARIEEILAQCGAAGAVDLIVGSEDVRVEKPDPEGLLMALARLGADPAEALYVGDSLVDAETARRAGTAFAAVLTGMTPEAELRAYNPDRICGTLTEALAWITRQAGEAGGPEN